MKEEGGGGGGGGGALFKRGTYLTLWPREETLIKS